MRNPANAKLRTTAVMGLLLLGAGARFAAAQTPVPQQLNDLRKQVNQEGQPAPAAPQTKPSSPATSNTGKPPVSSSASAANKPGQAKPSSPVAPPAQTKTASATATLQTKPPSPAASTTAKPPVSSSASAANKPGQAKPSNPPAPQAQAKTASATATNKPADAKVQAVKPGSAPAAVTAQAKPGAQPPVKVVNVKPGPTESSSKAHPSAATAKTVAAPGAQPKAVPAVAEVPEVSHVARRDPFDPLVGKVRETAGGPQAPLPAGKPGLVVATLRVDGIVKGTGGMIAIVSNPSMRVYFLREGDRLYDGAVEHITMEGVSFHETGKDAFGKSVEREVTKRLYPTPGEQQ